MERYRHMNMIVPTSKVTRGSNSQDLALGATVFLLYLL